MQLKFSLVLCILLALLACQVASSTTTEPANENTNTETNNQNNNNDHNGLSDYVPKDRSEMLSPAHREAIIQDPELADRADLLFRRLDSDFDRRIGDIDAERGAENGAMSDHMPGVTLQEFKEFIQMADKDKDGHLNRDEFLRAIATGLQQSADARTQAPEFVEVAEAASASKATRKQGFIGAIVANIKNKVTGALNKALGLIDKSQDGCVMCQYIVERIESNVKASGVLTGAPGGFDDQDPYSFIQVSDSSSPALVETAEQGPFRQSGAAIISSSRQATRYQRQVERQKFNEIYRIADITLDDVCEQGMPNAYYGFCKSIYYVQSDIVDGLRYQYRPTDVCFRVGMCKKNSYITKGIHSRYK